MPKEKIYIFSFVDFVQVSPDDFEKNQPMFVCDEDTTIKQAMEWARSYYKNIKVITLTLADTEIKEKQF